MNADDLTATGLSFHDYWEIVKRRKWWMIAVPILVIPVVIWIGLIQPKVYRTSATILVGSAKVPKEYVMESESSAEMRLNQLRREILKGKTVTQIVNEFGLYPNESVGQRIAKFQSAVTLQTSGTTTKGQKILEAFALSYEGRDPETVMKVTNRLAFLFVEENRNTQEEFVKTTSEFLDRELANYRVSLEKKEAEISEFKRRFMGELPDQLGANLGAVKSYQTDLRSVQAEIKRAEERKALIETELASGTLEGRLAGLKGKLMDLRAEYKDNYPDVVNLKLEIASLEQLIAQQSKEKRTPTKGESNDITLGAVNPKLSSDLSNVKLEINALNDRHAELTGLIRENQKRVDSAPVREQELLSMTRDYERAKEAYQTLLDKKLKVSIAESLERQESGGQFQVLEWAGLPESPIEPNMSRFFLIAVLSGLGGGIGLVVLLESADTSFHKPKEVEKATGLKVLCTVPRFKTPRIDSRKNNYLENGFPSPILDRSAPLAAQQYQILCAKIDRLTRDSDKKVLAFTSAVVDEGKSLTSLNVALSMAKDFRRKTLLIEGDLQKVTGNPLFRGLETGLVEVITGRVELESALVRLPFCSLTVLPRGDVSKINPVELLSQDRMKEILDKLRTDFDYIIVDCSPLLPLASTGLLTDAVDLVFMVVRAGHTPRALVEKGIVALENEKVAGIVLNNIRNFEVPAGYYHYHYTHV